VNVAGNKRQHQSPWLLTDASHIILTQAKQRCYVTSAEPVRKAAEVIDLANDEDAWDALDGVDDAAHSSTEAVKGSSKRARPKWLPNNIQPVLEELPKWELLAETLKEIEEEMIRQESLSTCKQASRLQHGVS
jgi:DNA excision repair protein ERCC-4